MTGQLAYIYLLGVCVATVGIFHYADDGHGGARLALASLLIASVWPLLPFAVLMGRMIRGTR